MAIVVKRVMVRRCESKMQVCFIVNGLHFSLRQIGTLRAALMRAERDHVARERTKRSALRKAKAKKKAKA